MLGAMRIQPDWIAVEPVERMPGLRRCVTSLTKRGSATETAYQANFCQANRPNRSCSPGTDFHTGIGGSHRLGRQVFAGSSDLIESTTSLNPMIGTGCAGKQASPSWHFGIGSIREPAQRPRGPPGVPSETARGSTRRRSIHRELRRHRSRFGRQTGSPGLRQCLFHPGCREDD